MSPLIDVAPESYFDAVAIIGDAPESIVPMTVVESHLYAYLGCILGLFRGCAIADWGYRFAVTSDGFPFSAEFERARLIAVSRGLADEDSHGMMTARLDQTAAEIGSLLEIGPWADRRELLRAATQCALALPVGSIRYSIGRSPGFSSWLRLGQRRLLLQADDIELLYDEYEIVRSVLGTVVEDLLSPAVIWLSARVLRLEDASGD